MGERTESLKLAERLLNEPNCDPDDDLRVLSRQLIRRAEVIARLEKALQEAQDPHGDLVNANRDVILRFHEDAVRRIRKCLRRGDVPTALLVIERLNQFHPMHGESWKGWPEGSDA